MCAERWLLASAPAWRIAAKGAGDEPHHLLNGDVIANSAAASALFTATFWAPEVHGLHQPVQVR